MAIDVLGLGACLLSAPISPLIITGRVRDSWLRHGNLPAPATYTLDEMLQMVRFMRGEFAIPPIFRSVVGLHPDQQLAHLGDCFEMAQVVLIEINSPVAIRYGRFVLSRSALIGSVLHHFKANADMARVANAWYNQGLMATNDKARDEASQALAKAIPSNASDLDLACSVLVDARPYRRDLDDLVQGLAEIRDAFKGQLGVMTYTHQYMPDGRPLPWPADFVENTIEAANRLGLPVFRPSEHVKSYGADRALTPDRVHYQDQFAAHLAESLWEFVQNVAEPMPAAAPRASQPQAG